jgi:hypothetical protein
MQLRDHAAKFGLLARDACQVELRLGLGEPQGWSVRPEGWQTHSNTVECRSLGVLAAFGHV